MATRELKDSTSVASTTARGVVELATSAETTAGLAVQASDTRLAAAADLATHIGDTSAAHAASAIAFAPASGIAATDVQAAIVEDAGDLAAHLADTTAAHAATAIAFTPAGTIAATTVQAALEEVAAEAGGAGLPTGGAMGQVLTKQSSTDGDADWATPTGGGGGASELVAYTAPPLVADGWTWVNQGSATADDHPLGGIYLSCPSDTADSRKCLTRALPPTPYALHFRVDGGPFPTNFQAVGVFVRESSSGKFVFFELQGSGSQVGAATYNSATSGVASIGAAGVSGFAHVKWLRITDDGTTRAYDYSTDGRIWIGVASHTHTTFITPDEYGIFVNPRSAYGCGLWLRGIDTASPLPF